MGWGWCWSKWVAEWRVIYALKVSCVFIGYSVFTKPLSRYLNYPSVGAKKVDDVTVQAGRGCECDRLPEVVSATGLLPRRWM